MHGRKTETDSEGIIVKGYPLFGILGVIEFVFGWWITLSCLADGTEANPCLLKTNECDKKLTPAPRACLMHAGIPSTFFCCTLSSPSSIKEHPEMHTQARPFCQLIPNVFTT